jgi:hypothetical protein
LPLGRPFFPFSRHTVACVQILNPQIAGSRYASGVARGLTELALLSTKNLEKAERRLNTKREARQVSKSANDFEGLLRSVEGDDPMIQNFNTKKTFPS